MAARPVSDQTLVEQAWSVGVVRDRPRSLIPDGGVYDAVDFMLEQPGRAYKRGGWQNHSDTLPAPPSMVGYLHNPVRVVAIANEDLYDVTSEASPEAILAGTVGFSPHENPPEYVGRLILCAGDGFHRPKKAYTVGGAGDIAVADLGGTPPYVCHSTIHASRIVLANGQVETPVDTLAHSNRLWFSELPDVEGTWDTDNKYLDTTYEVTGLASIQGVLLVFSPHFTERILNGVPPGVMNPDGSSASDMVLQPVGGVGCMDARSIVHIDNQVVIGSQEGIFVTNGVGFDNLMEKTDRSGILSYWRSLFVEHVQRSIVCGMLDRNYLFVSTTDPGGVNDNFVCYLPTRTWWRTSNTSANMFAAGATEQQTVEMYGAMHDTAIVGKFSPTLKPMWANRSDGNNVPVEPVLETRTFGTGPALKAYGFGRVTYDMGTEDAVTPATMAVSQAVGIEAETFTAVRESPLPATTVADRARFRLFKDTQALTLRLEQQGPSEQTELFILEVEERPYPVAADGE